MDKVHLILACLCVKEMYLLSIQRLLALKKLAALQPASF
ncbi:hypothetical protein EW028_12625 [Lysinibacillus sp. OL1]|nr:hypothetical protein EW028_12625 [Lysinibacillus sp. OL1]